MKRRAAAVIVGAGVVSAAGIATDCGPGAFDGLVGGTRDAGDQPDPSLAPPRPLGPMSTSFVTSQTPTFKWALAAGTDGAIVELCRTRACATVERSASFVATQGTLDAPLAPGTWFWRLRGRAAQCAGTRSGPVWQMVVGARTAAVSTAYGSVLDVNGDGAADLVASAPNAGHVFVYFGGASGLPSSPSQTLSASGVTGSFGASLASAGDVDGDGFGDLVVGAPGAGGPEAGARGSVFFYRGGPSGVPAIGQRLDAISASGSTFGQAVAGAGDMNGDGYGDIVATDPSEQSDQGAVWISLGGPDGPGAVLPPIILPIPGATRLGVSATGPCDFNGDGLADVAFGAPATPAGAAQKLGSALVTVLGNSGLDRGNAQIDVLPPFPLGLGFGTTIDCADVNGDGYSDVFAGAADAGNGVVIIGFGSSGGVQQPNPGQIDSPAGIGGRFGVSVASAGDVDGDGIDDLVIGASGAGTGGRAYFYHGGLAGDGGVAKSPFAVLDGPDGAGGLFGIAVRGLFDVGTGTRQVAIGAQPTQTKRARIHVYRSDGTGTGTTEATVLDAPDDDAAFGQVIE